MEIPDKKDEIKLKTVFPNEIWITILGMMSCFKDYRNISSAAKPFQRILHSFRATVLFGGVVKILHDVQKELPYHPNLNFINYSLLRQACNSWRNAVDGVLNNLDSTLLHPRCEILGNEDFAKFWKHFRNESRSVNPFPNRSVMLGVIYPAVGSYLQFVDEMLEILREFGHHIWHCKMQICNGNPETRKEFFDRFPEFLKAMPNLRSLMFDYLTLADQENELAVIDEALPAYQIPRLPHLWRLYTKRIAPSVARQLVGSNPQIKVADGNEYQLYLEHLPNLEQFSIHLEWFVDFERFRNYSVVSPLKNLELTIKFDNIPWNDVLPTVAHHFGETLVGLKLYFLKAELQRTAENMENVLSFPALKTVTVDVEHAVGLDFLLPLRKNVENLSIFVYNSDSANLVNGTENRVRLYRQFDTELKNSNVWELFEKLRCVCIQFVDRNKVVCTKKSVGDQICFEQKTEASNRRRF